MNISDDESHETGMCGLCGQWVENDDLLNRVEVDYSRSDARRREDVYGVMIGTLVCDECFTKMESRI